MQMPTVKCRWGNKNPSSKGLLLSIVAGVLMGFFYKYVAASMFPDFDFPQAGKLSPYTAVVFFSLGILLSNFLFNSLLMRRPFTGTRVSYSDYFKGGFKNHITGILVALSGARECRSALLHLVKQGLPSLTAWARALRWWRLFGVFLSGRNSAMLLKALLLF